MSTVTLRFTAPGLAPVVSAPITVSPASGPVADHVALTTQPSTSGNSGQPFAQQPVAQLRDVNGNNVAQPGVSVTASLASGSGSLGGTTTVVTNASGQAVFTNLAITGTGTFTVQFVASGLAGAVSAPIAVATPGSNQDVLTTIGDASVLHFWSLESSGVTVDGNGHVATVADVRDVGTRSAARATLLGVADGGGNNKPAYDPVTGSCRSNQFGGSTLMTAWGGDASLDLSLARTIVWFGCVAGVSQGSQAFGLQLASDPTIGAHLSGGFDTPSTLDMALDPVTGSGEEHHWRSQWPLGTTPRLMIFSLPQPTGANHSLQATPQATVEMWGRFRKTLLQNSPNDNVFTRFPSGAYRLFFGGSPYGANNVNSADVITYGVLVIDHVLNRTEIASLERWATRRNIAADTAVARGVACVGDSRTYGNGAANYNTDPWPIRLQYYLGASWDVDNRGVSGDGFTNAVDPNILPWRVGNDKTAARPGPDWAVIWEGVNSFNNGMTAADALTHLDTLIAAAKADGKLVAVCRETTQTGGIPAQPAYNQGVDDRLASGAIDAMVPLDTDPNNADMDPSHGNSTDGLHYEPSQMDRQAFVIAQVLQRQFVLSFDWAPVAHPEEYQAPKISRPVGADRVFFGGALGDGYAGYAPYNEGGGTAFARVAYPRSSDLWGQVPTGVRTSMSADDTPNHNGASVVAEPNAPDVPFENGSTFNVTYVDVGYGLLEMRPHNSAVAADDADTTTYRRSMTLFIKGRNAGDVGKKLDLWIGKDPSNYPTLTILTFLRTITIQSATTWQREQCDFGAESTIDGPDTPWLMVQSCYTDQANAASGLRIAVDAQNRYQAYPDAPLGHSHFCLPIHARLGVLSQFVGANSWLPDSDAPTLYGGAGSAPSSVAAPDSDNYLGGRTVPLYTVPNGGGFTTGAPITIDDYGQSIAAKAAYLGIWIKPSGSMPAAGALRGYLVVASGPTYGPVNLVPDAASVLRSSDGSVYYRCRIPINLAAEGFKTMTPKIQNDSGSALTFYAYRLYAHGEQERLEGNHQMVIGHRALNNTRPENGVAFISNVNLARFVSRREGLFVSRQVWPYGLGDMKNLGILSGSDWVQSGPYGSADYSVVGGCGVAVDGSNNPTHPALAFDIARGSPATGDWKYCSFAMDLPNDPTLVPGFVAHDIAVAWKDGAIIAVGLGEGTGTSMTWIDPGGTYRGSGPMAWYSDTTGQDWELSDPIWLYGGVAAHAGLGADRDRTRMHGGWLQAFAFSFFVNPATVRAQVEQLIATRWGARQDYR